MQPYYSKQLLVILFLSVSLTTKPSEEQNIFNSPAVKTAAIVMLNDLLSGKDGSYIRTAAGCTALFLSANIDNTTTKITEITALSIVGWNIYSLTNENIKQKEEIKRLKDRNR